MLDAKPRHYGQYVIVTKVWPASANMHQSSFTVHKMQPGSETQHLPQVHQEGREGGMVCETAAQAEHDAWERAVSWIDRRTD